MSDNSPAIDYHIDLSVGKAPHVAFSVDDDGIGRLIVSVTVAEPRAVLLMDLIGTIQRTLRLGQTPARKTTWAVSGFVGDELTTVAMLLTTLGEWVRHTMPPIKQAEPVISQPVVCPVKPTVRPMQLSAATVSARPFVPCTRIDVGHLADVIDKYWAAPNSPSVDNRSPQGRLRMRNQVINLGRGRLDDMDVSIICAELVKGTRR